MKIGKIVSVVLAAAVMVFYFVGSAMALFTNIGSSAAPVERLIKSVTAYIKEHPNDAKGYYTLGRVHYLAFSMKSAKLVVWQAVDETGKKLLGLGDQFPLGSSLTEEQLKAHLKSALENYHKAIAMDGKNGLYHLGLACAMEQGAAMADKVGLIPREPVATKPSTDEEQKAAAKFEVIIKKLGDKDIKTRDAASEELRKQIVEAIPCLLRHLNDNDAEVKMRVAKLIDSYWLEQTIASYLEAYKLALEESLKNEDFPDAYFSVGYEAGDSYIRLVKARGETEVEKKQIEEIQKFSKTFRKFMKRQDEVGFKRT
ncbi:MAG: hypothetical protein HZA50_16105 [Planctomycetes bacterium]|nr:hypothetical protein [Planctomycetota bacterium]